MPVFITKFRYPREQMQALVGSPSNREEAARKLVEPFGGRLLGLYFTLGEYDGMAVMEFPDEKSGLAALMKLAASGAVTDLSSTRAFTADEAMEAMRQAGGTQSQYRPPSG